MAARPVVYEMSIELCIRSIVEHKTANFQSDQFKCKYLRLRYTHRMAELNNKVVLQFARVHDYDYTIHTPMIPAICQTTRMAHRHAIN